MTKRFQRPINEYNGSENLLYRDKYQQDSNSVPKIAISSTKVDGDFNYLVDAVNTLDEDIKSVVHSGIANETIDSQHISAKSITDAKVDDNAISSRSLQQGSVTNAKIADLSVTTPKVANNSITKDKMATDSIGTDELVDKSITKDKLADDAISDSVPVGTIAQFSVTVLPTGWILCNGSTISKNTYPQLVKFLTSSDVTLSADLPNLNEGNQTSVKYAIKAFSDVAELANIEIAGVTQDIANNNALIKQKASKLISEPIAAGYIRMTDSSLIYSYNIKSITRIRKGYYKVQLDDSLKGKLWDVMATGVSYTYPSIHYIRTAEGSFEISLSSYSRIDVDAQLIFRLYERKGDE